MLVTLNDVIRGTAVLSHGQKAAFLERFTWHCCEDTKRRILAVLENPEGATSYNIYNRVTFQEDACSYHTHQHYGNEVKHIRKLLLRG